jgi:putative ABC transport system permease protein
MLGNILALVVGVLFGGALIGAAVGLAIAAVAVAALAATVAARRDWVPLVYNVRSLRVRRVTTAVTVAGLSLVVVVFAVVLMLAGGIRATLRSTGDPLNAKVIRKGSQTEIQSGLLPEHLRLVAAMPEVATGGDGRPLASAEVVVLIYAHREGVGDEDPTGAGANVTVRGLGPAGMALHPPARLDGRLFRAGTSELVIGKDLVGKFAGARLGGTMRFARRDWRVVGVMDQGGSAFDSEVWGDAEQVLDAFQRRPSFSSITIRLRDRAVIPTLQARFEGDPQLNTLEIASERRYWEAQSEQLSRFVTFLGTFVAVIFAVGAVLGAMITMYAQVSTRVREIGTLRAMGFRRRAVLVSFVVESVLLGMAAGAIGLGVASFAQLAELTTTNFQTFSEITFRFALTPRVVVETLLFAATMGFAGGLLPAMRAARMPITRATRGG